MSVPGLSLVGFMDQTQALTHLEQTCVPSNASSPTLVAEWTAAKAALGPPFPNAGNPSVSAIPTAGTAHVAHLSGQAWFQPYMADPAFCMAGFYMIEIAPLLAFQHIVNKTRSNHHGALLGSPPSLQEMLDICLPITPTAEQYNVQQQPGPPNRPSSLMIKARSLNLRVVQAGYNGNFGGVVIGPSLPVVQVCEFNGKYFLSNGFHRAYCLAMAGATEIPCILRRVSSESVIGIQEGTFPLDLLQSNNPPTLGHFIQNRAHDVQLRLTSRVITVSWSEWTVLDE
jgi:hypothetical protein